MMELSDREPLVTAADPDEAVEELTCSLEEFYRDYTPRDAAFPPGLDGALRSIFENLGQPEEGLAGERRPASELIHHLERDLPASVYRWTGHFPERTLLLLRHLAERADRLDQVYPEDHESPAIMALTTLVTALAMNHVHRGSYDP
jgi:hypothetical protein